MTAFHHISIQSVKAKSCVQLQREDHCHSQEIQTVDNLIVASVGRGGGKKLTNQLTSYKEQVNRCPYFMYRNRSKSKDCAVRNNRKVEGNKNEGVFLQYLHKTPRLHFAECFEKCHIFRQCNTIHST
jgi:hypothetical protein